MIYYEMQGAFHNHELGIVKEIYEEHKGNAMDYERMKQNLSDAGCGDAEIKEILDLSEKGLITEALQKMKKGRCRLMEELHESGRKVDLLDFLIRQTEKEMQATN